MLSFYIKIPPE